MNLYDIADIITNLEVGRALYARSMADEHGVRHVLCVLYIPSTSEAERVQHISSCNVDLSVFFLSFLAL